MKRVVTGFFALAALGLKPFYCVDEEASGRFYRREKS